MQKALTSLTQGSTGDGESGTRPRPRLWVATLRRLSSGKPLGLDALRATAQGFRDGFEQALCWDWEETKNRLTCVVTQRRSDWEAIEIVLAEHRGMYFGLAGTSTLPR